MRHWAQTNIAIGHCSLRYFEHDIQDTICYRASLQDCKSMFKLQGVNIMMMWEDEEEGLSESQQIQEFKTLNI